MKLAIRNNTSYFRGLKRKDKSLKFSQKLIHVHLYLLETSKVLETLCPTSESTEIVHNRPKQESEKETGKKKIDSVYGNCREVLHCSVSAIVGEQEFQSLK